jgi:adenylate kinase family enzyme
MSMRRVSVVGNSSSGKSTFAAELARLIGGEHIELDSIFHQPGWTELPDDEFRAVIVERMAASERWVADGNYSTVADLVKTEADTIIWLDLPKRYVRTRVVKRTLSRLVRRTELWNGNRERAQNLFKTDPQESIIVWAWTQHDNYTRKIEASMADPRWQDKVWVRLRHPSAVKEFLDRTAAEFGSNT